MTDVAERLMARWWKEVTGTTRIKDHKTLATPDSLEFVL